MKSAAARTSAGIKGRMAVLIVGGARLGIGKDFVSVAEFLELFLGGLVTGIFVGMEFDREFAVGLFDFLVTGIAANPQHLVIIALGHAERCRVQAALAAGFLATT